MLEGSWSISDASTEKYRSEILDAKMDGFRVVFIILVPIMCLCLFGNFFVADTTLKGDVKEQDQERPKPLQGRALQDRALQSEGSDYTRPAQSIKEGPLTADP